MPAIFGLTELYVALDIGFCNLELLHVAPDTGTFVRDELD